MAQKQNLSKALTAIGLLFIFLPLFFCYTLYPYIQSIPTPWHSDLVPSVDTYVSSNDSLDHSSEPTFKVGRYSNNGTQIIEIGLLWLTMAPPPGPSGSLMDITLDLHSTYVGHPGFIRIHRLQENESWNVDLFTLNYTNMPTYDIEYFAFIVVDSEEMYTIDLLVMGGFNGYSVGGIAVIADPGVYVEFSTSEYEEESARPLVRLSGEKSSDITYNPLEQPWICYSNPLSWVPMGVSIALFGYIVWIRYKSKSSKTTVPFQNS